MSSTQDYARDLTLVGKAETTDLNFFEIRKLGGHMLCDGSNEEACEAIYEGPEFDKLPRLLGKFMVTDSSRIKENIIDLLIRNVCGYLEDSMDDELKKVRDEEEGSKFFK